MFSIILTQYSQLKKWADGDFVNDYTPISDEVIRCFDDIPVQQQPHALTRAARFSGSFLSSRGLFWFAVGDAAITLDPLSSFGLMSVIWSAFKRPGELNNAFKESLLRLQVPTRMTCSNSAELSSASEQKSMKKNNDLKENSSGPSDIWWHADERFLWVEARCAQGGHHVGAIAAQAVGIATWSSVPRIQCQLSRLQRARTRLRRTFGA